MDATQIGNTIGTVIVVIITGIVSYITGLKQTQPKPECNDNDNVTFKDLRVYENKCYEVFVQKESYDKEFSGLRGELQDIKKSQNEQSKDIQEIKLSSVSSSKDIEFIKATLSNLINQKDRRID